MCGMFVASVGDDVDVQFDLDVDIIVGGDVRVNSDVDIDVCFKAYVD